MRDLTIHQPQLQTRRWVGQEHKRVKSHKYSSMFFFVIIPTRGPCLICCDFITCPSFITKILFSLLRQVSEPLVTACRCPPLPQLVQLATSPNSRLFYNTRATLQRTRILSHHYTPILQPARIPFTGRPSPYGTFTRLPPELRCNIWRFSNARLTPLLHWWNTRKTRMSHC